MMEMGWYVLIGLILSFFALPVILMLVVYGTLLCIVAGFIIFRYRTRTRPIITNEQELSSTELYLDEESLTLQSIKTHQEECRSEKARIYLRGDRSRLSRRESDG